MNGNPSGGKNIALKNVVFDNFLCGTESITFYDDNRLGDDMGDPVRSENVTIIKSENKNRPRLNECHSIFQNWFMEDYDGTLGPDSKGRGFLIRDNERTKAFLPENACEALSYDDSDCTAFCKDVCLRLVHLKPTGRVTLANTNIDRLQLTDLNTLQSKTYTIDDSGKAIVTLPGGQYDGEFLDSNGNPVTLDTVEILTFREPRCSNFVTESDFTFSNTASPTKSPTATPSVSPSASPTSTPSAAPSAEPTKYYDMTYAFSGTDLKCPSEGRLFKNRETTSLEECHERCFNMPDCNFFSYKASSNVCMGCLGNLEEHGGFEAYELTSIKDPSDFGYNLWNGEEGMHRKCPWKVGGKISDDRIGKFETSTRTECYKLCKDNEDCGWFSWGEDEASSSERGDCLLCNSDANLSSHSYIYTYEMIR